MHVRVHGNFEPSFIGGGDPDTSDFLLVYHFRLLQHPATHSHKNIKKGHFYFQINLYLMKIFFSHHISSVNMK